GLVGHGGVVSGTGLVGVGSGVRRDVVRRLGGTVGEPTLVVVGGTRRRVGGPAHSCFLTDSVRVGRNWRDLLGGAGRAPAGPVRGDRGPGPGRAGGTRTHNRRFWRPVRYQLRHCPRTIPASRGPSSGACRAASSMAEETTGDRVYLPRARRSNTSTATRAARPVGGRRRPVAHGADPPSHQPVPHAAGRREPAGADLPAPAPAVDVTHRAARAE